MADLAPRRCSCSLITSPARFVVSSALAHHSSDVGDPRLGGAESLRQSLSSGGPAASLDRGERPCCYCFQSASAPSAVHQLVVSDLLLATAAPSKRCRGAHRSRRRGASLFWSESACMTRGIAGAAASASRSVLTWTVSVDSDARKRCCRGPSVSPTSSCTSVWTCGVKRLPFALSTMENSSVSSSFRRPRRLVDEPLVALVEVVEELRAVARASFRRCAF